MIKMAEYWIEKLTLSPHPEGGFFRETYRSAETIRQSLPDRYSNGRSFSTAIYFLLKGNQFSAFHRLESDEIWHFYTGHPLTLFKLNSDKQLSEIHLGSDPDKGQVFQAVITAGSWFAATVDDENGFALIGCTVAPGFDFQDFEIGERKKLLQEFPQHQELILKLTPDK